MYWLATDAQELMVDNVGLGGQKPRGQDPTVKRMELGSATYAASNSVVI